MKSFKYVIAVILVLVFHAMGFGKTRIYLLSDVKIDRENLMVSDICKMEGDDTAIISNLVISPELYRDSIIDNKELFNFLSLTINKELYIFGTGVKITKNIKSAEHKLKETVFIERGELTELSIKNNGITIEIKGKALERGCLNDEINFKLSTGKIIKGKVISLKKADIKL